MEQFRAMRRKSRELPIEYAKKLLFGERRGVLAVNGDDGYPFAIPVNYYYDLEMRRYIFMGRKVDIRWMP